MEPHEPGVVKGSSVHMRIDSPHITCSRLVVWIVCDAVIGHGDMFWVLQYALLSIIPDGWACDTLQVPLAVELVTADSGRHLREIEHRYVSARKRENVMMLGLTIASWGT